MANISDADLLLSLKAKVEQIEVAPNITHITGLKLLKGYSTHYRIKVVTKSVSFRVGAVIRGNTIWLVRFLPRRKIYQQFP